MNWPAALDAQHTVTHEVEIVIRLLLAAAVGAAIGIEREMKDRPAGLRTHMLTALASAVFTILTFEIYHGSKSTSDPIRIVEAVTAGVAFLAAGVVIFTRGQVHGLTTGAGMWLAGAIGVACGLGLWQIALFSTLLALVVLALLYAFESKLDMNQGDDFSESESDQTSKRTAKAKGDKPKEAKPAR
jgi:putative Mg2+ transporter-C (MgtC) family protein